MRSFQFTGGAIAALTVSLSLSAFAQTPTGQTPTTQTPTAATQTFTGCLMTERDYRSAHNLGAGTVAGAGLGDEFVLVDVKVSAAKSTAASASSANPSAVRASASTSSAAKCADQGTAYRLTGSVEDQISKDLVGRQVEIQGRFKDPEDPRTGEKMPNEVEVLSFREAPAAVEVSEPAAPVQTAPPPPVQTAPPPPVQTAPPPPVQTAPPPQVQTAPPAPVQPAPPAPAQAAPAPTTRSELPRTASSSALLALIGVVALSAGLALTIRRRRAV